MFWQHPELPALNRDAAVAALDALVATGYSASLSATVVDDHTFWRVESRRHGDERDLKLSRLAADLGLELLTSGASARFALVALRPLAADAPNAAKPVPVEAAWRPA